MLFQEIEGKNAKGDQVGESCRNDLVLRTELEVRNFDLQLIFKF